MCQEPYDILELKYLEDNGFMGLFFPQGTKIIKHTVTKKDDCSYDRFNGETSQLCVIGV